MSSGGQRSSSSGGSAESVAAGCSLRELRPKSRQRNSQGGEMEGLAVFTFGRGEDGQLGLGDTCDSDEPKFVDALRGVGVRQIACGSGHTVVLTTDGEVYTWGRGDDGRLGHGDNGWKYVPRIIQSLAGQIVVQVTCGSYHTAAVTGNGDLYTWGGGMYGKLGHGNENGHSTPKRVEALVGLVVSMIACGSRHTAVVTSPEGNLYTWGDNEAGTTGIGSREGHQYSPKLLERLAGKRVVQLSACGFHTGCLTDSGNGGELELYTFGEGKFGRLGTGNERNCHTPHLVEAMVGKKPRQVSCGGFHTAVVTEDGKLYTTGGGEHGQLGHNDRVNRLKPTFVQALDGEFVSEITCGWSHSVALTAKGLVYTWGNSDHGKLGVGSSRRVSVPQLVEKLKKYRVVKVASYNEHTAVLVEPFDHVGAGLAGGVNAVPVTTAYNSSMRALVNDEEFSDVTFTVEDQPVYAHRALLASRCEHFAAMFRSGMRESAEKAIIPIPDMSRPVFLLLLEYIYTDSVKIELEHAIELYIAADLYQLERLRDMCCTVVRRNLNAENSGPLLQNATEAHCHILKEVCMAYVVENFDVVSKTEGIKQVSHSLLLEILAQR
ncbi:RCC1 and BTB domain-containing protein 2 [Seminavis robusta]|uniref:RCC1 and BTB domain-containing protein 2 n=1 Tax=Seminavis robusta TaxID=568900 RepID=A0A9N8DQT2_9STRA|nr:RCC1 and BTB domain-containing protein 2 [Seminavis robusta]|eukprot:Sro289_g109030.1 RCC1 and BTB domain-containing protein 2 (604) ;mRNA; r:17203-19622